MRDGFTVLLVADPPPAQSRDGGERPAGRQEALVSLARAVFAVGGRIVVPVDAGVAVTVATVALEYEGPRFAERRTVFERQQRVLVMETEAPDRWARSFLSPFVARGAIEYLNPYGEPVTDDLDERPDDRHAEDMSLIESMPRQSVTPTLLRIARPRAAVLISSSWRSVEDLSVLREHGVTAVAFGNTAHDREVAEELSDVEDPGRRDEHRSSRWSTEREVETVPYAFLMQDLVARWIERPRRRRPR